MAKVIGGPSKYLQEERLWSKIASLDWMLGLFLSYFVYLIVNHYLQSMPLLSITLGIGMFGVYKIFNKQAWKFLYRAGKFKSGLDGEAHVADLLREMPDSYIVIQDVKLPESKSNIDFVVVGPSGVCAIEVKSHKGNMTFEGNQLLRDGKPFEQDVLRQAKGEAISLGNYIRAKLAIPVFVRSILVFSHPKATMKFGHNLVEGVAVIGNPWFLECIQSGKELLTQYQINDIVQLLSSTVTPNSISH